MTSAPKRCAIASRAGTSVDGDDQRGAAQLRAERRAQADRALGEDGDRVADPDARRFRRRDSPVEKMSGTSSTSSSLRPSGIGARLARASGTSRYSAHAPSMVLPNRQPPSGPPHCECAAVQAVEALPAGRDRADHRPAGRRGSRADTVAERVDDADRLVAEHQARSHGVLALDDVHVGPADRRRRDADDGLAGPGYRLRPLDHAEPPWLEERHCRHRVHRILLSRTLVQDDADDVP